jgi:hypothetical protein
VSSTASSNGSLAKIGPPSSGDMRRGLGLADHAGISDAKGLAVVLHSSTTGRGDVLQPVTVWAVGQQYRYPRPVIDVGAEYHQRGAVRLPGAPADVLEDAV